MKEVITVELETHEIEDAIANYLADRGYKSKNLAFKLDFNSRNVTGVEIIVDKAEAPNNQIESVSVVRDEVWEFAKSMESQLRVNYHKGGWNDISYISLTPGITKNHSALLKELSKDDIDKHEITIRCANIANYAMMIADNYGEGI